MPENKKMDLSEIDQAVLNRWKDKFLQAVSQMEVDEIVIHSMVKIEDPMLGETYHIDGEGFITGYYKFYFTTVYCASDDPIDKQN